MATLLRTPAARRADALVERVADSPALILADSHEPAVTGRAELAAEPLTEEPSRALALSDAIAIRSGPGEALIRFAYRLGVPGHALATPFRRPPPLRVLATVDSPNRGDRMAGTALRAGHFLVHGARLPIASIDFACAARHVPGVERVLHSFSWLADLAASAPRADGSAVAERVTGQWLHGNSEPGKGQAWDVEYAGLRLVAWLVHAPLVLGGNDKGLKSRMLAAIARSGELGDVLGIRSTRANWTSPRRDTDSIWNLAPHDITIAKAVLGHIPSPRAAVVENHQGMARGMTAMLGNDPYCVFEVSNRYERKEREVRVHGTNGIAILKDEKVNWIDVYLGDQYSENFLHEARPFEPQEPLYLELMDFLQYLDGGSKPISTFSDGLEVIKTIHELQRFANL